MNTVVGFMDTVQVIIIAVKCPIRDFSGFCLLPKAVCESYFTTRPSRKGSDHERAPRFIVIFR